MVGAPPSFYVEALQKLRERTDPREIASLGLRLTPADAELGRKNLIAALQGLQGAGPGLTPVYKRILADPQLRPQFIAAISPLEGGWARAPRKNRTYKKRKSSRKGSRKAARIL
jgi:hypothetical protein